MFLRVFVVAWVVTLCQASAQNSFSQLAEKITRESSRVPFTWNAAGDKFIYAQGGSLWLVEVASGDKKAIAKLPTSDDCHLFWSKSRSALMVCDHSVISVNVNTGRVKKIASSDAHLSDALLSPDGAKLAFIRSHNLQVIAAAGGAVRALTTNGTDSLLSGELDPLYAYEFGLSQSYWWAPDSSAIAYLETDRSTAGNYPQAGKLLPIIKLKLLTLASGMTTDIATGDDERPYLAGITWLPTGARLAYQRLNRLQNQLDMSIYDCATGQSKQVYSDKDPYWINLPGAAVFLGDHFLITSERSGSRHIYLYGLDGHLEGDMTPGKIEVTGPITGDPAKSFIYFHALTGSMRDLQLYRAGLDGKEPQLITKQPGWHEITLSPDDSTYLDSVSTIDRPPKLTLRRMDDTEIASLVTPEQADVPKAEFPEIKLHNDVPIPAMLWKPVNFDADKKYPVIVYTFSGPQGHVVKNAWGGWQNAWNRAMAEKGFLVMAVDVRGSGGYGHYFEEYIHYRFGAQETADLREVFSYLARQPYVDAQRIGIWGCDYGAHNVVHAMLEFPNGFAAGFADSPITDWTLFNAYFTERYIGLPARRIKEYADSSALDNARRLHGRLLVASSPANPVIPPDQVEALQKALDKAKKPLEVITFPNANYHQDATSLAQLMDRMSRFFSGSLARLVN